MLTPPPTTLSAFRAFCGAPTCPLDACSICKTIPDLCSQFEKENTENEPGNIPWDAVERLVPFIGEITNSLGEIKRCPACGRIYSYQKDYDPMPSAWWSDYDAETTHTFRRRDVEELFRSPWFTCLRILDRFPGYRRIVVDPQTFFHRHVFATVELDSDEKSVVLFDEDPLELVAGRLDLLARVASGERPDGLGDRDRAIAYATFADRVTSEYDGAFAYVDAFDDIRWRRGPTAEDRAQIEDLRAASSVSPLHVDRQVDAFVVRRWVIARQRLICRLLTVLPTGEVRREDAVVGEDIPIDPALQYARTR